MEPYKIPDDDIKTIRDSDGMSYTATLRHTEVIEDLLMSHRRVAYQHVWDVRLHNAFLDDFYGPDDDIREAVLPAIAVLTHSRSPYQAGADTDASPLMVPVVSYHMGRGYHIICSFEIKRHCVVLYFIRHDGNDDVDLALRIPQMVNPSDWRVVEMDEINILESYGYVHRGVESERGVDSDRNTECVSQEPTTK